MSSWQSGGWGPGPWQFGPRIAGMGTRIGAWLIDAAIFGAISMVLVYAASATGAIAANPEALRQIEADPNATPTVPLFSVDPRMLALLAAVWVAVAIVYPLLCWSLAGGLPGQRLLGLRVVDSVGGGSLSPWRALARAVVLYGCLAVAWALSFVAAFEVMSTQVPSGSVYDLTQMTESIDGSEWSVLFSICGLAVWLWPLALLIATGVNFDHRGPHDLAGRSMVVRMPAATGLQPQGQAAPTLTPFVPPPPPPPAGTVPGAAPGGPPAAARDAGPNEDSGWHAAMEPEPVPGRVGGILRAAPFGRRATAYLMDNGLILIAFSAVGSIVMALAGEEPAAQASEKERMIVGLAAAGLQLAYFVGSWWIWRGSLGQRIMGVLVVSDNGDRLPVLDGVARWAALQGPLALSMAVPDPLWFITTLGAAVWTSVLLTTARTDPLGRGLHDRIAGSRAILAG